jgi:hypothetical protein
MMRQEAVNLYFLFLVGSNFDWQAVSEALAARNYLPATPLQQL